MCESHMQSMVGIKEQNQVPNHYSQVVMLNEKVINCKKAALRRSVCRNLATGGGTRKVHWGCVQFSQLAWSSPRPLKTSNPESG